MCFLLSLAFAAEIVVDVQIPSRVALDGVVVAEVYRPVEVRLDAEPGKHDVQFTALSGTVDGPVRVSVEVVPDRQVVLAAGMKGLLVASAAASPTLGAGPWPVHFRAPPGQRLMVQVDDQRVIVAPGGDASVTLAVGEHRISVRSSDGTMVFARGFLRVGGGDAMVIQLTEGALPLAAGTGVTFIADQP
jgi:hypothetical protein